jgi:hypothetical protein
MEIGANVITFIQLTDRVIDICKFYIESIRDTPHDVKVILIEVCSLKSILENLKLFLLVDPTSVSEVLASLEATGGTFDGCQEALGKLEKLFPEELIQLFNNSGGSSSVKTNVNHFSKLLSALQWPHKKKQADKLLAEIHGYKATISLALSTDSK